MELLESEKNIFVNLNKKYKWIARDKNGDLNLYETKPTKSIGTGYWASDNDHIFNFFENMFKWISWEDAEPYRISKLLNEGDNDDADAN